MCEAQIGASYGQERVHVFTPRTLRRPTRGQDDETGNSLTSRRLSVDVGHNAGRGYTTRGFTPWRIHIREQSAMP